MPIGTAVSTTDSITQWSQSLAPSKELQSTLELSLLPTCLGPWDRRVALHRVPAMLPWWCGLGLVLHVYHLIQPAQELRKASSPALQTSCRSVTLFTAGSAGSGLKDPTGLPCVPQRFPGLRREQLREVGHTAKQPQGGRPQGLTLCHGNGLALKVGALRPGPASHHLAEPSPSS